jgi:hypothetical protein
VPERFREYPANFRLEGFALKKFGGSARKIYVSAGPKASANPAGS